MNQPLCEQLDAYLLGHLSPQRHRLFEEHLAACGRCQADASMQRRIDSALHGWSLPTKHPENAATLVHRAVARVRQARRRRRSLLLASVAAVVAACALLWFGGMDRPAFEQRPDDRAVATDGQGESPQDATLETQRDVVELADDRPRSIVTTDEQYLALQVPLDDPAVTIAWLYPVVHVVQSGEDRPSGEETEVNQLQ